MHQAITIGQAQPDRIFYILDITPTHEFLWEIDGYCLRNGKTNEETWTLHIVCPKCRNNLTIESKKKPLEVGPETLSVELFRCSHPAEFGGVCSFSAAIEPPQGNHKTTITHDGVRRRVDGVYRRN